VQLATEVRLAGMRFASRTSNLKSIPALSCRSAPWWDCRLWSGPADICREVIVRSRADMVTFCWHWMSRAVLLSERLLIDQPDIGPGARPYATSFILVYNQDRQVSDSQSYNHWNKVDQTKSYIMWHINAYRIWEGPTFVDTIYVDVKSIVSGFPHRFSPTVP